MSMLKGYRPSSALQAMFSVYHGTFNAGLFTELNVDLFNCAFIEVRFV